MNGRLSDSSDQTKIEVGQPNSQIVLIALQVYEAGAKENTDRDLTITEDVTPAGTNDRVT